MNFKDDLIEYKCLCCNNNYQQKFDEKLQERFFNTYIFWNHDKKLKERFFNTYKFWNHDKDKSILLLRKGVYPYEYMDDLEKFNETSLLEIEDYDSHLNMEILLKQIMHTQKEFVKILK